ncbi:hypothetical protein BU24DRAFT_415296 [Aaosphaeria arxii CBS 175.79]|uniref:Uncharacterized protein n=1 Tax=Aaosphaeria arxii CBS 175.79 TaxID=1450172 RepID=A0A6A5X855_9PLEO|nr:uncharacterized protein BU24DRAFT_415296 [Aaosphaeria arxii CBS 175.79]KAF2008934.1 hypothetical protein BU24DRAFT_415296 [Aaosphaeria arxii CBS 175.79]
MANPDLAIMLEEEKKYLLVRSAVGGATGQYQKNQRRHVSRRVVVVGGPVPDKLVPIVRSRQAKASVENPGRMIECAGSDQMMVVVEVPARHRDASRQLNAYVSTLLPALRRAVACDGVVLLLITTGRARPAFSPNAQGEEEWVQFASEAFGPSQDRSATVCQIRYADRPL